MRAAIIAVTRLRLGLAARDKICSSLTARNAPTMAAT